MISHFKVDFYLCAFWSHLTVSNVIHFIASQIAGQSVVN